ncbi:hypothetical protein KW803_03520 [Candidatus Saccharibacteria bacterium]|nr:hypothetical protein [Candidatus Saccharibacteria bacterium]
MQPSSPDPQFDFMLKNNQPAKKGMGLPHFPKPLKIIVAILLAIVLIIIASSVLSGRGKGSSQAIINAMARGQETMRVTTLVQTTLHLQDPGTQALAATVSSSLSSDSQQMADYLSKNGTKKIGVALLAVDTDKSTDSLLQTASQNNNLDNAYKTYLKDSLTKYAAELQTAYNSVGPKGKIILKSSLDSTQTLLGSSLLKT